MQYLQDLTLRLGAGIGSLPEGVRQRHIDFLLAAQQQDGGFRGREGSSDLYYTSFALRSLAILGELTGTTAERAGHFVQSRLQGRESIVDFFSLIYSAVLLDTSAGLDVFSDLGTDWKAAVAQHLAQLRRPDGGYAKGHEGRLSSTYHTFLVLLCLQSIEQPIPDPDQIVSFLRSQEAEDGGFREIKMSKRAGTNPTAAAIAALRILNALDDDIREGTLDFLCEMQTDEGGLRANTRIPIADLLSTFTGSLTLLDLSALDEIDVAHARAYAESLEQPSGGFLGAVWDQSCDVEYTFYGLGCLALLTSP